MKEIIGKIAIAGNPNSGKTTVFNALSGKNERVGNWAGVTVAKKESLLRRRYNYLKENILLVDLPGAYGMDAYTKDELEATNFLQEEDIDVIINVVDGSNLERSLRFTMQLINTGIPVVVALNKSDITKRKKIKIDIEQLSNILEVPVVFTQADRSKGLKEVVSHSINKIEERVGYGQKRHKRHKEYSRRSRAKECRCK